MNKNDRHLICTLIAEWEWNQLSGVSEAGTMAGCGRRLQQEFRITNEELAFYRAYQIHLRIQEETGRADDDLFFDVLMDQVEEDLDAVVDQVESMKWDEFASYIESMVER